MSLDLEGKDKDRKSPPARLTDCSGANESEADQLLSLMERVEQFQQRRATSISPGDLPSPQQKGRMEVIHPAAEGEGPAVQGDQTDAARESPPPPSQSPEEMAERLEHIILIAGERLSILENLLQEARQSKAHIERWRREIESLTMIPSGMSPTEAQKTGELILKNQRWRPTGEESLSRADMRGVLSPAAQWRARQMRVHYSMLAALLLERYREIHYTHAEDPRIKSRVKALAGIRRLIGRMLHEEAGFLAVLGEKIRQDLFDVRKACSNMALDIGEEAPLPPLAEDMDGGLPPPMDPMALDRLAEMLIRQTPSPPLFLDDEALYLQRLRKSLARAVLDYRDCLEVHRRRCCMDPAVFENQFDDFVRLTLIPRIAEPLEGAARKFPEHAQRIQYRVQQILDLARKPGQSGCTWTEPQEEM